MRMQLDQALTKLRAGTPPDDPRLLGQLTLGREIWLDPFRRHQLETYLRAGGSKVKVLVGPQSCGKSHLLACVAQDARDLGYAVVALSARSLPHRLGDLPALYRTLAQQLDLHDLVSRLCGRVVAHLGHAADYSGSGSLVPLLTRHGLPPEEARREIREATAAVFQGADVAPSFLSFLHRVVRARLVSDNGELVRLLIGWLQGEKHDRAQRGRTGQFETLRKPTARAWLVSLVNLLRLGGIAGLAVLVDDLEALVERSPATGRYTYSVAQAQDTLELIRQIIDDTEVLGHFVLLLAGKPAMIEDPKRGFKSYEALWMRLQTGLVPGDRFNCLADLVDVAKLQAELGADLPDRLARRVTLVLDDLGLRRTSDIPRGPADGWSLRAAVVAAAGRFAPPDEGIG
ncbi:MAG: DUF2791 family P-loop domain-containing protein [Cyanobacteria bacterium REEB65]|nr:DUF2791 family P-loop domain-containing protein [Cyanobacteria bacterium REEB65]